MKKRSIFFNLLLLSLSTGFAGYGKSVDENTAITIGSNFLISNGIPGVQSSDDLVTVYLATAQVNGQSVVDYYVFNIRGSQGFVMVSGDDNIIPILAYSKQSYFDINTMSPSAKDWVEGYQNQITYVLAHNLPAKEGTPEKWNNLKVAQVKSHSAARTTSIFPSSDTFLCQATWNQNPQSGLAGNYNGLCPTGTGGRAVTGCVATAMAQLMKFWNWPTVGTGSHTYTPSGYSSQTADFGNTFYEWPSMPDNLASGNNIPIETIMFHAGVSVEMQYGSASSATGSGAYVTESESPVIPCAEYALKTYFHYKRSLFGQLRSGCNEYYGAFYVPAQAAYTDAAWTALLEGELNAGRPMLYKGQEPSGAGHCWVCDGYEASGYMHFNWGWSGTGPDGYYSINSIAPPALGTGAGSGNFNADQGVIIGIEPDSYPATPTGKIQMGATLDCPTSSAIPYNTAFSIVTKITNTNTTTFTGSFCGQVFDTLNNLVGTVQTLTGQTLTAGSTSASLTFSSTGLLNMIPGLYYLRVMYQATGTSTWTPVANNDTLINDNLLKVGNTNGIELLDSISVTTGTTVNVGAGMTVNAQIGNMSETENFNGSVRAVLTNLTTGTVYPIEQFTGASIGASVTSISYNNYSFTTGAITAPAGNYVLSIEHQPGGTGTYYVTGSDYFENPIRVNVIIREGVNTLSSGADNIFVYPNPASDLINIATQGINIDAVRITDIEGREIMKMNPDNNQSIISIPVSSFAAGIYLVQLQTGTEFVTKKIVITK